MTGDRDTVEISLTLPRDWVENEMMETYPAATRASQACRMAVQSDVQRKQGDTGTGDFADSLLEVIRDVGGSLEDIQRVQINAEEAEINHSARDE